MEKTWGRKATWRNLKFGVVLFLILGFGSGFILIGCGAQSETKDKVKLYSGTPTIDQKQGDTLDKSEAAGGTTSLSPESLISASQLDAGIKAKKDWVIIDVREIIEFATGHVPMAKNIPLGTLKQNLNQFPKDQEIILVCLTGDRAFTALQTLIDMGYDPNKVKILIGGMEQWKSLGSEEVTESIGGC